MARPPIFTDQDLVRIKAAIDDGLITWPEDQSVPEPAVDTDFDPFAFPAVLEDYGSMRSGDVKITLVVPRKWRGMIEPIGATYGKRLVVKLARLEEPW